MKGKNKLERRIKSMTTKIKKRGVQRIEFYIECYECKQEIKGNSKDQVQWNLYLHVEKHKKEAKKK